MGIREPGDDWPGEYADERTARIQHEFKVNSAERVVLDAVIAWKEIADAKHTDPRDEAMALLVLDSAAKLLIEARAAAPVRGSA